MEEISDNNTEIEFMRKNRFDKIKSKFANISKEAEEIIDKAEDNQILSLTLTFNSPVKIVKAEIFDDQKFVDLVF